MKKGFIIFKLTESVDGFGNRGITYDEYSFGLRIEQNHYADDNGKVVYETIEDAEKHIEKVYKDFSERNVEKDLRFVILPIYYTPKDNIIQ